MSEPVQLAKEARQKLAAALSALQAPDVPDELVAAAEPVAQAMGVLHRIERTNGANLDGRKDAVDAVRAALGRVQLVESPHPAVETVMEAIAGSLSKVHALMRYEPPAPAAEAAPAPQPVAQAPAPQPVVASQTLHLESQTSTLRPAPHPVAVAPQPAPVAAELRPVVAASADKTLPLQPSHATMPMIHAQQASPNYAQNVPSAPSAQVPRRETPPVLAAQLAQPARPLAPAVSSSASKSDGSKIDVELGIHSASNFYKGLGGNDVIEHGGIFVATYKVAKLNAPVTLRVLLPGDYEFTASGVVQWTREAGSTEPGYGVRFTQISAEGRQLVYRYTRNREPMFYDDL